MHISPHAFFLSSYLFLLLTSWLYSLLRRRHYADWALDWSEYGNPQKVTLPVIWWLPLVLAVLTIFPPLFHTILLGDVSYLGWCVLLLLTGCYLGFKSWIDAWRKGMKTKFDPYYSLDIFGHQERIDKIISWLRENNRFNKFYPWIIAIVGFLAILGFVGILRIAQRFMDGAGSRLLMSYGLIFLGLWGISVICLILSWLLKLHVEGRLHQTFLEVYGLLQQRLKGLRS